MSLRPPRTLVPGPADAIGLLALDAELRAEKVAALDRSERAAKTALAVLRAVESPEDRVPAKLAAAKAVHAFFIQRELMGFRRHGDVIEAFPIPREVLALVGAC
ncbi:DUF6665 family protein [Hansschlegelia sp. KR7-227]|uniref:DUF6665 family protein n=1 Tax=Hansschlegelia sp. KR7-227 TaxID=3400914 RepID=UPI003C0DA895